MPDPAQIEEAQRCPACGGWGSPSKMCLFDPCEACDGKGVVQVRPAGRPVCSCDAKCDTLLVMLKRHGTPESFASNVMKAIGEITIDEAMAAVDRYTRDYDAMHAYERPEPPPEPRPSWEGPPFLGRYEREIGRASEGAHLVRLVECSFPDGARSPYVELSETHDGCRPPSLFALSTLVHLAQNVGEIEAFQIGNREAKPANPPRCCSTVVEPPHCACTFFLPGMAGVYEPRCAGCDHERKCHREPVGGEEQSDGTLDDVG